MVTFWQLFSESEERKATKKLSVVLGEPLARSDGSESQAVITLLAAAQRRAQAVCLRPITKRCHQPSDLGVRCARAAQCVGGSARIHPAYPAAGAGVRMLDVADLSWRRSARRKI